MMDTLAIFLSTRVSFQLNLAIKHKQNPAKICGLLVLVASCPALVGQDLIKCGIRGSSKSHITVWKYRYLHLDSANVLMKNANKTIGHENE